MKRGWSMSEPWLSTHIERWPTEKLVPYIRNARTHSEEQVAQIAASIVEFGFTNPILAGSDGVIVAGHGRLAAAQKLGLDTVPVPADTPPDAIAAVYTEVAAMAFRLDKPLSCRLLLFDGTKPGDLTSVTDNPYIVNTRVFAVQS